MKITSKMFTLNQIWVNTLVSYFIYKMKIKLYKRFPGTNMVRVDFKDINTLFFIHNSILIGIYNSLKLKFNLSLKKKEEFNSI